VMSALPPIATDAPQQMNYPAWGAPLVLLFCMIDWLHEDRPR
jgi:hypothetical protein